MWYFTFITSYNFNLWTLWTYEGLNQTQKIEYIPRLNMCKKYVQAVIAYTHNQSPNFAKYFVLSISNPSALNWSRSKSAKFWLFYFFKLMNSTFLLFMLLIDWRNKYRWTLWKNKVWLIQRRHLPFWPYFITLSWWASRP